MGNRRHPDLLDDLPQAVRRAASHKGSGDEYLTLRNDARVFREIRLTYACDEQAAIAGMDEITKPPQRTTDVRRRRKQALRLAASSTPQSRQLGGCRPQPNHDHDAAARPYLRLPASQARATAQFVRDFTVWLLWLPFRLRIRGHAGRTSRHSSSRVQHFVEHPLIDLI